MRKTRTILFGTSTVMERLKKALDSNSSFDIIGWYDSPNENKETYDEVDLIIVSSYLFFNAPEAMENIEKRYLMHGCLLKTDLRFYDKIFKRVPLEGLLDFKWIIRRVADRDENYYADLAKRTFDLIVSFTMIVIFLLPMCLIWLLIKGINGYDPIFIQKRIGLNAEIINIYKFRTMMPNTENITRLGNILRRFRIDEFPQLFNILKGEISFVGPRPIYIMENIHLNKHVHNHALRLFVKPGLTGWAQLNFKAPPTYCVLDLPKDRPDDVIYRDAYMRLAYDLWYIENRSLFMDMKILLYTLKRAFVKDNSFKS